jgi:hypothetical protein
MFCIRLFDVKLPEDEFDVYGSVHLGNVYVRLEVQLDAHEFVCMLYFTQFALHVSGANGCCLDPASGAQTAEYNHRYA